MVQLDTAELRVPHNLLVLHNFITKVMKGKRNKETRVLGRDKENFKMHSSLALDLVVFGGIPLYVYVSV